MVAISRLHEIRALAALCTLMSLSALAYAGAINTQELEPNGAQGEQENPIPSLDGSISLEERMRLHRDLNAYSRSIDSNHIVIENHRRGMRQRLYERFSGSDKDNDGSISREEATETMPQIARHFNQVDTNGDGVVTLNELAVLHARMVERQLHAEEVPANNTQDVEVVKSNDKEVAAAPRKKAL